MSIFSGEIFVTYVGLNPFLLKTRNLEIYKNVIRPIILVNAPFNAILMYMY